MLTNRHAPLLPSPTKSARSALLALAAGSAIALTSVAAHAAVVTSVTGGVDRQVTMRNVFTSSAISESGFTFTSTSNNSIYGYSGLYGLASNGNWEGGAYIGLNVGYSANQFFTLTFDDPVASVLAFVNYAPGYGTPYMAAYDASNHLIESTNLSFMTPNGYNAGQDLGFTESSNIIKSVRFGDAYIVAADIVTAAVPIPNTVLLMGLGLGTLMFALRRRKDAPGLFAAAAT